jgi:TetR/AcrR family transcriptional regulator
MNETATLDTAGKILTAARAEFIEHGLAGARIDRIARRARVNKAMIYYHFNSKENLYQTVIDRQLGKLRDFFRQHFTEDIDPEKAISRLVEFYVSMHDEFKNFAPIILREMAAGGERFRTALTALGTDSPVFRLKNIISKGQKDGLFRSIDDRQTVASFLGMNLYYLIISPIFNSILEIKDDKKFLENRSKAVADLFFNGLKKH